MKLSTGLLAEPLHVRPDPVAVVGGLVHHLAVGLAEPDVVLEEVVMPVDVGHDELLVDPLVAPQEVGVAGVVVDDHLVDLLEPVAIALGELLVLHAEPPVGVPGGEPAQGGDLGELVVVEHLEDGLVEVEPVGPRVPLDLDLEVAEVGGEVVLGAHDRHRWSPHLLSHVKDCDLSARARRLRELRTRSGSCRRRSGLLVDDDLDLGRPFADASTSRRSRRSASIPGTCPPRACRRSCRSVGHARAGVGTPACRRSGSVG